ncbi:MAG: hypothetical protein RLZZ595_484 [Bacteroidota bacterium]|jgi:hypothetical protein
MKRNLFSLILFFVTSQLFAQEKMVVNDENVVLRDVGTFSSVVVRGPFKVYYSTDAESQVAVSANTTTARDRITTKVSNSTLYVTLEDKGVSSWWSGNKEFKIYLTAPKLNGLIASGAVNFVVVDALKAGVLNLNFSGASDFNGKVICDELKANLSGASDTKISGSAQTISLDCSGASSFKGLELGVNQANLDASGASSIKIKVNERLTAKASGASSIQYSGNPKIFNQSASGASSIKNIDY